MDAAKKKPLTQGNLDQTEARLRQLRHDLDDDAIKRHGRTALVLKKHGASDSLAAQLLCAMGADSGQITKCIPRPHGVSLARSKTNSQPPGEESGLAISTEIASALRSLKSPGTEPSQTTPTLGTLLSGAKQDLLHTTLEVDPADITEERSARGVAQLGPHPRRPPRPPRRIQATGAAAAFKSGVLLRARRQYEEAIMELERALADPSLRTRATYLIGLCYLDDHHTAEAISWLMRGVNTPQASEAELSELFYALGQAHEQGGDAKEAILCFQLSLGPAGRFRDAAQRLAGLQQALRRT